MNREERLNKQISEALLKLLQICEKYNISTCSIRLKKMLNSGLINIKAFKQYLEAFTEAERAAIYRKGGFGVYVKYSWYLHSITYDFNLLLKLWKI